MSAIREKLSRTGDLLLRPGHVLLPEGPRAGMAVVVRAGTFHRVDTAEAVARDHPDLTPVDLPDHLLMPGFVDTHTHLTQSLGKSLVFGEPSEIFRRIWVPLEGSLDERMVYLSAKLAALECLRGGFTTAVDAGTRSEGHIGALVRAVGRPGCAASSASSATISAARRRSRSRTSSCARPSSTCRPTGMTR